MSAIDLDNPEFLTLQRMVGETGRSVFLTGKAGTGKSTFLRYIIEHTDKQLAVLAPTGIAAVNVGGQTLHSFFHLPLQPYLPDDPEFAPQRLRDRLNISPRLVRTFRELELIVIDEISMVRADTLDFIDRILRYLGGDRRKPFGGKQLLLVGDVFQLEPVVTAEDRAILDRHYRTHFFFGADVFREFGLTSIELRKVYRQKEGAFVELLDRLRGGMPGHDDIRAVNARYLPDRGDEMSGDSGESIISMTLAGRREAVARINDLHLARLDTEERVYTGTVTGEFPPSSFPTDFDLRLKVGAQVIFLRNDMDRRWVNGTLGVVTATDENAVGVRLEDGREFEVKPVTWDNVAYEYDKRSKSVSARVRGSFTQYPLRAAWALTVHKSQGLTFDNVVIDLGAGGAFAGGQVYVALSRCTSFAGIRLLRPIELRDVYVHPEIIRFSRSFNDRRDQERALEAAECERLLDEAAEALEAGDFRSATEAFGKALQLNPTLNTPAVRRLVALKLRAASRPQRKRTQRRRKE